MKRIYKLIISMQSMAVLLIVYAVAMAIATFVENDYGAKVAKHFIYGAKWFEFVQFLLVVNMIGNVFKYKLYKKSKLSILLFHVAFIVIFIGAAVTRYIGYEGMMHIREGQSSNILYSSESYLQFNMSSENKKQKVDEKAFISPSLKPDFSGSFNYFGKEIEYDLKNIIPNPQQTIIESLDGSPIMQLSFSRHGHLDKFFIGDNAVLNQGGVNFSLNSNKPANVEFTSEGKKLYIKSAMEIEQSSMNGGNDTILSANQKHEVLPQQLYNVSEHKFVITDFYEKARLSYIPGNTEGGVNYFALEFELKSGNDTKKAEIVGANGSVGDPVYVYLNDIYIALSYGAKEIELPFALKLRDFQLDRYPGSNSPSSYASEVTLVDNERGINEEHRIFMNNVLDYSGFRFFQSSYDRDEKGTILSVNHDLVGTIITYVGYFLMTLGMLWALFSKNTYFIELIKRTGEIRKTRTGVAAIIVFFFLGSGDLSAQTKRVNIDEDHANSFGELMVQDNGGRTKPFNTLTSELLRKISRKNSFMGWNSNQVYLGLIFNPEYWKDVRMIKVSSKGIKEMIGVEGKYASFNDLVNLEKQEYKLRQFVDAAFNKEPGKRDRFDKDVIAVDERINIFYQILKGGYLKVFPTPVEPNKSWLIPAETGKMQDSTVIGYVTMAFTNYYNAIIEADKTGDWSKANQSLQGIKDYQLKYGESIMPSETRRKAEIHYINADIFNKLFKYYGIVGFIFLIVLFVGIFKPNMNLKIPVIIFSVILGVLFLINTYAYGLRWYVSGRAPLSNGYESMIFIAWSVMMIGLALVKRSPITLSVASILASIVLMVAHLNWMNPEITPLVPVLKSIWLTIHVSVIVSSYAFLAIGALLGFLNLILMIFKNAKNAKNVDFTIRELTIVTKITMIIGLYLLTIGAFLGGVWANESWGRYWGWDPKETWALITIIVYTFVIHSRQIPSLNNSYAFNFMALFGFSSVLMTYFGVNYYLSGLHSYASGDPVPVPAFVYYSAGILVIIAVVAYLKYKKGKNKEKVEMA